MFPSLVGQSNRRLAIRRIQFPQIKPIVDQTGGVIGQPAGKSMWIRIIRYIVLFFPQRMLHPFGDRADLRSIPELVLLLFKIVPYQGFSIGRNIGRIQHHGCVVRDHGSLTRLCIDRIDIAIQASGPLAHQPIATICQPIETIAVAITTQQHLWHRRCS